MSLISGAIKTGVPTLDLKAVPWASPYRMLLGEEQSTAEARLQQVWWLTLMFASPKSASLMSMWSIPHKMFSGLMSRWAMPATCAVSVVWRDLADGLVGQTLAVEEA